VWDTHDTIEIPLCACERSNGLVVRAWILLLDAIVLPGDVSYQAVFSGSFCIQAGRLGNNKGMRSAAKSLNNRTGLAM
jgi:hypothetical protein